VKIEQRIPVLKIVSGGQTGADRAALDFAIANKIPHGGWCPKGRKAEDGCIPACYSLTEAPSADYVRRTEMNVKDSDATVIFTIGPVLGGGSKKTAAFADKHRKPWLHLSRTKVSIGEAAEQLRTFLDKNSVKRLNVAGSRASKEPGVGAWTADVFQKWRA